MPNNNDSSGPTSEMDPIKELERLRLIWFSLIAACAYAVITISGLSDADIILTRNQSALPIIGTSISNAGFFVVGPLFSFVGEAF